jgi:hypothetical protein
MLVPSERIAKPAAGLAAALLAYAGLRQAGFYDFTAGEAEGLNVRYPHLSCASVREAV